MLLKPLLLLLSLVLNLCTHVSSFNIHALHEHMTPTELAYYFNAETRHAMPDYTIVYLPVALPLREAVGESGQSSASDYAFSAFGRPIHLKLRPNEKLTSPNFKTYIQYENSSREMDRKPRVNCHYLHRNADSVAAISLCQPKAVQGLLFLDNTTLEIHPLTPRLQEFIKLQEAYEEGNGEEKYPHIVRRAPAIPHSDNFRVHNNVIFNNPYLNSKRSLKVGNKDERDFLLGNDVEAASHRPVGALTAEVALFFDEAGYKIFAPFFKYDEQRLQDMLLAYMNGVQALYHHPSLGAMLEIELVRMDIMKTQSLAIPHHDGERSDLLDSFCLYQQSINPKGDDNPDHWDMALYVSGLDFFAYENGRKSGVTMGLATVGGVCLDQYACVIAELGTTNIFGKPYPSAGFTSVYILAHEIGHNLGMHHDSVGNSCSKEGYIMSPSRGTNGETKWSKCSADVMAKLSWAKCLKDSNGIARPGLDHFRFRDTPGQIYTAKKQCEILLRDADALVSPSQALSTICYSLECKTPHRSGYYYAGPALEGTECGARMYCFGGECSFKTIPTQIPNSPGGWGPWSTELCNSGCLEKSRGYQKRRRSCDKPLPLNSDLGCEGSSVDVALCKDDKVCSKTKRKSAVDYASRKCREFSQLLPELDPKGAGLQAPHEEARLWMGCAVFCKRKDSSSYYTPRMELNDLGVSPYFLDGTWCHSDSTGDYYCRQQHCLPENFQFSKSFTWLLYELGDDIPGSQNARPNADIPTELQLYLSLGADGKPLQTSLKPGEGVQPKEEDWETKDYIELPQLRVNEIYKQRKRKESDVFDFL